MQEPETIVEKSIAELMDEAGGVLLPARYNAGVPRQKLVYGYDWMGRRVSKVVSNWTGSAWALATSQRYVYDGWKVVAILDGGSSAMVASFVWGNDLSGTRECAGGIGGLLAMTVHSGTNAGTYFYAYDGNGNVVGLVNAATGQWAAQYEYGPFGEPIRATGPLAFVNPFRFSTKYCDDETGHYYYGYRYYSPTQGRWLSRDPLNESGGLNLYVFCINDPIGRTDYLGLGDPIPIQVIKNARFLVPGQYSWEQGCNALWQGRYADAASWYSAYISEFAITIATWGTVRPAPPAIAASIKPTPPTPPPSAVIETPTQVHTVPPNKPLVTPSVTAPATCNPCVEAVKKGLFGITDAETGVLASQIRGITVNGKQAVISVEAFGSRAGGTFRGAPTATSDLDVFVTLDSKVVASPEAMRAVQAELLEISKLWKETKGFPLQIVTELDALAPGVKAGLKETPFVPLELR